MYEIRVGTDTLYYAGDGECTITSGKLKQSLNEAGSLDITIPANNPFYDQLKQRHTELTVYQDEKRIWNGEVREIGLDFYKNKTVYCVGEMSYLADSIQPLKQYASVSKTMIFNALINEHNSQVESKKRFEVGAFGLTDGIVTMVTNWESTLDFIRNNLLGDDDCIRIRWVGDKRYIDLLPLDSYGVKSDQTIEFGDNLLDLTQSCNSEDLYTAVIPLGASKDESRIEDYEENITIEGVNGGKNYVYNQQAVNNFGWIKTVVNFDDVTDANELKQKGIEWLASKQFEKFTYKLSAVDMSVIDRSISIYNVGDYIRAVSEPHGMDVWLPVRSREIDLLNLANNKLTLGATTEKSLTQKTYSTVKSLEEKMPEETSILKAAKKNATALINANGTNGYVAIRTDDKGKPYEIDVMNASSFEQSTQVWRWNLNGFGHGKKSAGTNETTWDSDVAITMDGAINANFITAGAMSAGLIKGGELQIGGNGTAMNGSIGVYNANNTKIGSWNKNGISISSGSISGISITIGGNGTAKDGSINIYNSNNQRIGTWDKDGIYITSGSISGTYVDAQSGKVGPFTINADGYSGLKNDNNGLHLPRSSDKAIYIGDYDNPDIELNKNGRIYCDDIQLSGFKRLSKYLQQLKDQDLIED